MTIPYYSLAEQTALFFQHFQLRKDALALSAGPLAFLTTPSIRAQKEAFLPLSALVLGDGAGAFK
jgi:hypothetical protein